MIESYRSYVIRVRRRATDQTVRLDLEDLLGGRRVAVVGDEAQLLAERLRLMIASGDVQPEAQPEGQLPRPPGQVKDSA